MQQRVEAQWADKLAGVVHQLVREGQQEVLACAQPAGPGQGLLGGRLAQLGLPVPERESRGRDGAGAGTGAEVGLPY